MEEFRSGNDRFFMKKRILNYINYNYKSVKFEHI